MDGFDLNLAETVRANLAHPTAIKIIGRQGTQVELLLLPGRGNGLGLPVYPALVIFQTGSPELFIQLLKIISP
jgi:hypothetical protein